MRNDRYACVRACVNLENHANVFDGNIPDKL